MTREDINNIIQTLCPNNDDFEKPIISPAYLKQELEAMALEQKPCSNAIDRAEAIKIASGYCYFTNIAKELAKLPPVTPEPKMGHWIHFASGDDCSECGWSTGKYISPSKYCPNCGCKMSEIPTD